MALKQPHVHRAAVIAMRLVDMADAIDLTAAESLWAHHARTAAARGRLINAPPKAVAFGVPPVQLTLDAQLIDIGGGGRRGTRRRGRSGCRQFSFRWMPS